MFFMIFIGLGNPGKEFIGTRHNVGRDFLFLLGEKNEGKEAWQTDKVQKALTLKTKIVSKSVFFVLPETFMNDSGLSARKVIDGKKDLEKIIVLHDDMDLPIGSIKLSYARGSGGHQGVESIIAHIKSNGFLRVRIGISPKSAKGVAKKPKGEDKVKKFVLGQFSPAEKIIIKKVYKLLEEVVEVFVKEGRLEAMNKFN
jgi:PTH1 family peptidyl-tRNA hydrolase